MLLNVTGFISSIILILMKISISFNVFCDRSRPSSKMTKYVECWGADKPFANIAEATLAKNIGLTVSAIANFVCIIFLIKQL